MTPVAAAPQVVAGDDHGRGQGEQDLSDRVGLGSAEWAHGDDGRGDGVAGAEPGSGTGRAARGLHTRRPRAVCLGSVGPCWCPDLC